MADGGEGRPGESEQQLDREPEQPGGTRAPDVPLQVGHSLLFHIETSEVTLRSLS